MAIKNRIPKSENDKKEMEFIGAVEKDNLKTLSLEQLAQQFEEIEQQGQLLQGRILLEARERFRADKDFGAWIEQVGGAISSACRQHRTKLMNLARFFENRELDKIGISAAYEISAPVNADIAVDVYEYVKSKNLPLAEVRKQIAIRKGESLPLPIGEKIETISTELVNKPTQLSDKSKQDLIMEILQGLADGEKANILRECLRNISFYPNK